MPADASNATTDPGFFDGRLMVEIGDWDWNLHVRLSSPLTPPEARFEYSCSSNQSEHHSHTLPDMSYSP